MGRFRSGPHGRDGRPRSRSCAGFALVEVTLALLLIAVLAALAMPGLVRATGPGLLRVTGMQVDALLRDTRSAALRSGSAAAAVVDRTGRNVRSPAIGASVALPPGAIARAPTGPIAFFADGRSTGGELVLLSAGAHTVVSVSPDTGAIHVGAR